MKFGFACVVLLLSINVVLATSGPTGLLSHALAVHKRSKEGKNAARKAMAHNKSTKIKVSPAAQTEEKVDGEAVKSHSDSSADASADIAAIEKRQNNFNNGQQMVVSLLSMVLSRIIFKLDYKNPKIVLAARLTFLSYIILSQVLFWFLQRQVEKRDDTTLLPPPAADPLQSLSSMVSTKLAGNSPMGAMLGSVLAAATGGDGAGKRMTVKQYDLAEVKKLSSGIIFELLAATYMHFVSKSTAQLLMLPLMGIAGKLKAPIVQIHLLRMKPVGALQRPFKSGFEAMLSGLSGPGLSGPAPVQVKQVEEGARAEQQQRDEQIQVQAGEGGARSTLPAKEVAGEALVDTASASIKTTKKGAHGKAKTTKSPASRSPKASKRSVRHTQEDEDVIDLDDETALERAAEVETSISKSHTLAEQRSGSGGKESAAADLQVEDFDSAELLQAIDQLGELDAE